MAAYINTFGIVTILVFGIMLIQRSDCQTVQLSQSNIEQVLGGHEFVIVNFYADWCRFSNMLAPVFEDASRAVNTEFPEEGRVAFAKVDCDREGEIAKRFHVSKYPTLKMFRWGSLTKREYRGQRSVAAMSQYMRDQLKNPVNEVQDIEETDKFDRKKRHVIGLFEHDQSEDYKVFRKVASILRDDCVFHVALGPVSDELRIAGNKIVYKPTGEDTPEMSYSGRLNDFQTMMAWTTDKCIPLVREITFENAEELTEEGLPFVILFHHPDDTETPEKFRKLISTELLQEKTGVNFLTADGTKFTHPLYHLGKANKDLPILAIDSFKHMYLWKQDPKTDIEKPGLLKTFIADLHSGKLHREFHNGPDQTTGGGDAGAMVAVGSADAGGPQVIGGGMDPTGKAFHIDMQQQVITGPNGFKINIIRLMPHEGAEHVDAIDELKKIDAEALEKSNNDTATVDKQDEGQGSETDGQDIQIVAHPEITYTNDQQPTQTGEDKTVKTYIDNRDPNEPKTVVEKVHKIKVDASEDAIKHVEHKKANPPESIFNKLKPSEDRYTILDRDEL